MNWIDKLERKFGRYGIPNLTFYIVICYVLGYILMQFNPALLNMMSLEPAMILQGQVWRLITWVIYPPSTGNIMWFAISILFCSNYILIKYRLVNLLFLSCKGTKNIII